MMTLRYWLVLSSAWTAAGLSLGCSSESHSCYATRTCPNDGAGGAAHADAGTGGTDDTDTKPRAGGANANGEAGSDNGSAGEGGSGGEGGGADGLPVLFGACSVRGAFACAGHASAERLACDGARWLAGTTCGADQLCDSSNGKCALIVAECASAKPGAIVCREDALITCGPDLVTAKVSQTCPGLCKLGVCQAPVCGDEKVESGEDCEASDTTTPGACVNCKRGACGDGVVYADQEQCDDGNLVPGDGCSARCKAEPVDLALGADFTCARSSTGLVKCWGDNFYGELGLDDQNNRGDKPDTVPSKLPPIDLGPGRTATAISARGSSICALLDGGDVKCWGFNDVAQLGTGDIENRGDDNGEMAALKPISLGAGLKARSVSSADRHTCAVLTDGSLKCWGSTRDGQVGQGTNTDALVLSPADVPPIKLARPVVAVSGYNNTFFKGTAGYFGVTCALLDDSTLRCWGRWDWVPHEMSSDIDGSDGLGDYPGEMSALPVLKLGGGVSSLAIAQSGSAAVLNDGSLRIWGDGNQLGGSSSAVPTPADLTNLSPVQLAGTKIKSFALGDNHACAVLDDGVLSCWGSNSAGQLGIGSTDSTVGQPANVPLVKLGGRALKVAVGPYHTCAILDDGALKCWGNNSSGQLGLGDRDQRSSPDKTVDLSF